MDSNLVTLTGKISWFREYPFNGKQFSSTALRLDTKGGDSFFINMPTDPTKVESKQYKYFMNHIQKGSGFVLVEGSVVNRKKDDVTLTDLRVGLNGITCLKNEPETLNLAIVSGKVSQIDKDQSLCYIASDYRNVKDNTINQRFVPIITTKELTENQKVYTIGSIKIITINNNKLISISPIKVISI